MAHLSKIFTTQEVDIPNRSGHDVSFENLLSLTTGTLVPVLTEYMSPNDTVRVGHLTQISLPPMATNFFGRIDLRFEAFFVPLRTLWGGWQNFFTMPFHNPYSTPVVRPTHVPSLLTTDCDSALFKRGTLSDYIGHKFSTNSCPQGGLFIPNLLPFFAYHKIYDDWYRNKQIQKRVFVNETKPTGLPVALAYQMPWWSGESDYSITDNKTVADYAALKLADGVHLFELRQRNWAKDYFTTAALFPQATGDVLGSTVEFPVADDKGQISIPALRQANVLQRWADRNNVCGEEYADQIKGHYGILPSDAIMQRALFLGADMFGIYNRSVYSQVQNTVEGQKNPFSGQLGAQGGSAQGFKDGTLVDKFTASEHGYLVVLASIVPHAYYSTGTRRQLMYSKRGDFPMPLLQGLGEQPIYDFELTGPIPADRANWKVFGYQQQYSEVKYHDDEVHGLLVDGESLESFALQRSFPANTPVELSSEFLEIPKEYLDQVQNVATSVSGYNAWADVYMNFKKVSPFGDWIMPTLGDLKNTHKESIPYRGRML